MRGIYHLALQLWVTQYEQAPEMERPSLQTKSVTENDQIPMMVLGLIIFDISNRN